MWLQYLQWYMARFQTEFKTCNVIPKKKKNTSILLSFSFGQPQGFFTLLYFPYIKPIYYIKKNLSWNYLYKVVWEKASFPIEVSLHPSLLLNPSHVSDHISKSEGQLIIVGGFILKLHHHLNYKGENQACDQLETKKEGRSDHAHKPCPQYLLKIYILAQ